MAIQMMRNMMRNFGVTLDEKAARTKNVAVVSLTATLPPYARPGQTIDVSVNAMGDAKSLQGGTLMQSPYYLSERCHRWGYYTLELRSETEKDSCSKKSAISGRFRVQTGV